jgi:pimeloyl-ACP methyl ester carboxylesterase
MTKRGRVCRAELGRTRGRSGPCPVGSLAVAALGAALLVAGCAGSAPGRSAAAGSSAPAGSTAPASSTAPARSTASAATSPLTGMVDIGSGRSVYVECSGTGSPTVVLVSGSRNAHDAWGSLPKPSATDLRPGTLEPSSSAVFPRVVTFTRVCAYDRPGTMRLDGTQAPSTLVPQPTTAQDGVADLHAWLTAAGIPGPYVLAAHSWGGMVATLFASTYPDEVAGLVLVDPGSPFLQTSLTPAEWETFVGLAKSLVDGSGTEVPDYAASVDVMRAAPSVPPVPVIVLTSDQPFDFGAGGAQTWPAWGSAQARLAELLHADHITGTNSGHLIPIERPTLVIDAIREVVDAARTESP